MSEQSTTPAETVNEQQTNVAQSVSQTDDQQTTRRTPALLKKLLGKIHATARDIGNPQSFNGCIFFNASLMNSERENSYHIELRNCNALNDADLAHVHSIINRANQQPANQSGQPASTPTHRNRRSRPMKRKANSINIISNKIKPENIVQSTNSNSLPPTPVTN